VAQRIKTSTPYVGHLEAGLRHPSDSIGSVVQIERESGSCARSRGGSSELFQQAL
jgi:hypothetical protein